MGRYVTRAGDGEDETGQVSDDGVVRIRRHDQQQQQQAAASAVGPVSAYHRHLSLDITSTTLKLHRHDDSQQ